MPGAAGQLKALYKQLIGGVTPTDAASLTGSVAAMMKYLAEGSVASYQSTAGYPNKVTLPGHFTAPVDVTISGSVALTERFNYFKNLTINNGIVLTGLGGGTIIVVEETLTLANGSSQISVNELGAKGAASEGLGGKGGGLPFSNNAVGVLTMGALSHATLAATVPYIWPPLILVNNGDGGAGGAYNAAGSAGVAATTMTPPVSDAARSITFQWETFISALHAMLMRWEDDATYGGIGGGGGGAGGGTAGTGASVAGGVGGSKGALGSAGAGGGGGGGGLGSGGGGGGGGVGAGAGGPGGRGGGALLILCRTLNNAGLLTADGGAGSNGTGTNAGGGGGGGGGMVLVGYETLTALGTLRANGGAAGALIGTGLNGAAGAAGITGSFKIRSGV